MAHSRFAPSSSQRVADCPASLLLNEREPDQPSRDAAHGTAAHHLGELCLQKKARASKYEGCTLGVTLKGDTYFVHEKRPAPAEGEGWAFEVDDEMVVAVQEYVDWCNELPGDHFVEVRVDISHLCPDEDEDGFPLEPQGGTSDHIAVHQGEMWVTDLKYGKGVQVFAKNNLQGVNYASGSLKHVDPFDDVHTIHIRICQPRLNHRDVWTISRQELLDLCAHIKRQNERALQPNPPFGPTEKACRFCKVSGRCRAQAEYLSKGRALGFEVIETGFDGETELQYVDPVLLSDEELVDAWRKIPMINNRATAIAREMLRMMGHGHALPGVKLVEIDKHRKFADKRQAELFLRLDCDLEVEKVYVKKMVSPNQAMKLITKDQRKELAGMIIKPPGGPCIVDESDKRPPYKGNPIGIDGFDNLDDEEAEWDSE
jgi:hypothetical protein